VLSDLRLVARSVEEEEEFNEWSMQLLTKANEVVGGWKVKVGEDHLQAMLRYVNNRKKCNQRLFRN